MMIYFFYLFNQLYQPFYPFYKQVYFIYKSFSEREHIKLLEKYLTPGMTVLDIGANIGFYTQILAKLVGENGKVYAFEPDQINFKHLVENTKSLKNVQTVNKAVGQKNGQIKLYYSSALNVDHQTYDIGENRKSKKISMLAVDQFLKAKAVDLIKIDVQGYDYFALLGMRKTINNSKKVILVGELWPYGLTKAGVGPDNYLKLINDLGFKINFFGNSYKTGDKIDKNIYYDFYAIKTI